MHNYKCITYNSQFLVRRNDPVSVVRFTKSYDISKTQKRWNNIPHTSFQTEHEPDCADPCQDITYF